MPYKKKEKVSLMLYYDYIDQFECLTDEQLRTLIYAMIEYDKNGDMVELDDVTKMAFVPIKRRLDIDRNRWVETCETNRENAKKRWDKQYATVCDRMRPYAKYAEIEKEIDKEIDKDIEIDKININNIGGVNNNIYNNANTNTIYDFVEQNFGRTLNPIEYEEISSWEDNELTRYAIKQSVLSNKCTIKYISRILNAYQRENIKTVQQAQEREREYMEAKGKTKKSYKTSTERMNEVFERFLADEEV